MSHSEDWNNIISNYLRYTAKSRITRGLACARVYLQVMILSCAAWSLDALFTVGMVFNEMLLGVLKQRCIATSAILSPRAVRELLLCLSRE